ncbi:hypothetical protein M9458_026153, partial [Cirrhinus mrigala]
AAPTGEERVAPHYTVSEVSLPPLPELQGAAPSGELTSLISPPEDVAEPGRSSPPRGSLEQLVRQSPAGPPLQVPELAVQSTPEASLKQLVPLVDYLAAWKLLPTVSAWVLRTVEKGYSIQFSAPPPPFDRALVMEQEVETLLRKEAIEVVPPHDRESGFYSRYFIVPKKDGGLRPIIDVCRLNRSVMRLKFKMLTLKQVVSQIRSEDWFVTIDLKDAYFHVSILPQHRKFLRFAFRGEAYQYQVLPFGLALSPRTFTKCVDAALVPLHLQGIRILNYINDWLILAESESSAAQHRDVVLAHMKTLGLRLNAKKSVLSPLQRTTYLGVVWDSTTMQARLSPAPPFWEPDQQKLNCMCPVRVLDAYVHRAALWCKSDQLFVCYSPPKKGRPATKQTLSRWIVDAISSAYESSDLPSPLGVKAHSTRAMTASRALMLGVPIQDICNAAGWYMPLTFVRFYNLDHQATPGSSAGTWKSGGVGISGTSQVTYVTLVPRGNETRRLDPSFQHPC